MYKAVEKASVHLVQPILERQFIENAVPDADEDVGESTFKIFLQFSKNLLRVLVQKHWERGGQHFVAVEEVVKVNSHAADDEFHFHLIDVDCFLQKKTDLRGKLRVQTAAIIIAYFWHVSQTNFRGNTGLDIFEQDVDVTGSD